MKTLDEDVEALKKLKESNSQKEQSTNTGRKSNLAGLGALKSFNKYNSLTSKYRESNNASQKNVSVEQLGNCGTIRTQDSEKNNLYSNTDKIENTECIRIHSELCSNTESFDKQKDEPIKNGVFEYKNENTKTSVQKDSGSSPIINKLENKTSYSNIKFEYGQESSNTVRIQEAHTSNTDSNTYSNIDSRTFVENKLKSLSKNMAQIFKFLYEKCSEKMSLETGPIYRAEMIVKLGLSEATIKGTLSRIIKEKMLFTVIDFRTGSNGWTSYGINPTAFELYSSQKDVFDRLYTYKKIEHSNTNSNTYSNTTRPSKIVRDKYYSKLSNSSHQYSNTGALITHQNQIVQTETWFKSLDFSPVSPIGAMQVNSSIRTLVQEKLQREQVQEFLNRFKNWLATQQKIQNPLAIFCDRLKEFATEGDSAILSVMTDQEREIEAQFIEETKKAKAQIQLIEKAQIEKSKNQEENLRTEAEAEFEKWYNSASDIELAQMAPPIDIAPLRSGLHKISTKSAFMSKILLEKQK